MKDKIIMELIKAAVLKDIIKTKEEVREMLYFNEDFCDFCGEEYVIMSGSRMTKNALHKGYTANFCPKYGRKLKKMKVKLKPAHDECKLCLEYPLNTSIPDCKNCWRINRIYNLLSFVDSFWGTYALIEYEGKIQKVPYYRIEILKEEENEN